MGAILARAWRPLADAGFSADAFDRYVTGPTRRFAGRHIDLVVIAAGVTPLVNPAELLARWIDNDLTRGMRLPDLPQRPRFSFVATHLATGDGWVFSKPAMGDERLGVVRSPDIPIAAAVAASAAYPPFVAPFVLDLGGHRLEPTERSDLYGGPRASALHERVLLLDGGVHDNLGLGPIEASCRTALVSDAGSNLRVDARHTPYRFWWSLIERTLDITLEIARVDRRRGLIARAHEARGLADSDDRRTKLRTERVALWRTSLDVSGDESLPAALRVDGGWPNYLSTRPTRLWPMDPEDQARLIDWGYLTADVTLRRWLPELADAPAPTDLPNGSDFANPPVA